MSESEKITFEEALKQLEETVMKMEKGELSLDENIKSFEKGSKLADYCTKQLSEAEKKIEVLLKVAPDGNPQFQDFNEN